MGCFSSIRRIISLPTSAMCSFNTIISIEEIFLQEFLGIPAFALRNVSSVLYCNVIYVIVSSIPISNECALHEPTTFSNTICIVDWGIVLFVSLGI